MSKNILWSNGKIVDGHAQNLWYLTGIIDMWTQQKRKFGSDGYEPVRTIRFEFQFPKIERTWGDGSVWHHIGWLEMKLSLYKSNSPEMSNSKLVDLLLALWADALPVDEDMCLSFMKKYLNKPLLVKSTTYKGSDGNDYDGIRSFEKLDKKVVASLPEFLPLNWINAFFSFDDYNKEDFDNLQKFHQEKIKKVPEYKEIDDKELNDLLDSDDDSLPF